MRADEALRPMATRARWPWILAIAAAVVIGVLVGLLAGREEGRLPTATERTATLSGPAPSMPLAAAPAAPIVPEAAPRGPEAPADLAPAERSAVTPATAPAAKTPSWPSPTLPVEAPAPVAPKKPAAPAKKVEPAVGGRDKAPPVEADPFADLEDPSVAPDAKAPAVTRRVLVDSDPPGATVSIDGLAAGQTPLYVEWDDVGTSVSIRLDKPGYRSMTSQLGPRTGRAVFLVLKAIESP